MSKYFEPWGLEQWRGRSLYGFLGVRFFKRYLLPTELLLNRLRGRKAIRGGKGALKAELKRLDWETRRNEVIHLLALLLTGCILVFSSPQWSMGKFVVIAAINLYANVYPIFLQRYNRFRMMGLLGRIQAMKPKNGGKPAAVSASPWTSEIEDDAIITHAPLHPEPSIVCNKTNL